MTDDDLDVMMLDVAPDASIPVDQKKVLALMGQIINMLNTNSVSTMESFTIISSMFLSVMGTVPPEFRWRARAQLISMLLRASVSQDSAVHVCQQSETTQ